MKFFICISVAVLCAIFLSGVGFAREDMPDPAYLKAIEQEKQLPLSSSPGGKTEDTNLSADKEEVKKICVSTGACRSADFSDEPAAAELMKACKKFVLERRSNSGNSQEAYFCYAFLMGFTEAVNIELYMQSSNDLALGNAEPKESRKRKECPLSTAETNPALYVDFLEKNPDLQKKNMGYSVYLFYQELMDCFSRGE